MAGAGGVDEVDGGGGGGGGDGVGDGVGDVVGDGVGDVVEVVTASGVTEDVEDCWVVVGAAEEVEVTNVEGDRNEGDGRDELEATSVEGDRKEEDSEEEVDEGPRGAGRREDERLREEKGPKEVEDPTADVTGEDDVAARIGGGEELGETLVEDRLLTTMLVVGLLSSSLLGLLLDAVLLAPPAVPEGLLLRAM
ncbi:hypothetical protein MMC16_001159 [Acarospora aff. strigata]|nr:hypothetical protein [Acarospora aff. strigata]